MPRKVWVTGKGQTSAGTNDTDVLSGLGDAYVLKGGQGDDTYIVDADDVVDEKNNGGIDTIISFVNWILGRHQENLILDGDVALKGTGNELDNVLTGNAEANTLLGLEGNDTLFGNSGDDRLDGGAGSDLIDGGDGSDTVLFGGEKDSYVFSWDEADLWVTDADNETDVLRNIEQLSFKDQTIATSDLFPQTPETTSEGSAVTALAADDSAAGDEDSTIVIPVLSNDLGDGVAITAASDGSMGTVTLNGDGTITYRPNANAHGTDEFSYTIRDATGQESSATVAVDIVAVNDAPTAVDDQFSMTSGETLIGSVLDNDIDIDGDFLATTAFDGATDAGGSVHMHEDGTFSYQAAAGFTGTDGFSYTVTDTSGAQSIATASIDVGAVSEELPPTYQPPHYIEGLIYASQYDTWRLNAPDDFGTGTTVTYAFLTEAPAYYGPDHVVSTTFRELTEQQQAAARDILADIESFTNLTFVEAPEGEAEMTFGLADLTRDGMAFHPDYNGTGSAASDIWLDVDHAGTEILAGSEAYETLIHEIGHAVGLSHPDYPTTADETLQYTLMAGAPHSGFNVEAEGYQLYDVAALQHLYGANTSETSDDTYLFSDFDSKTDVIWDAGGNDTLDMSSAAYGVDLDLNAGAFSTVADTGVNNLAIAFGSTIENAIGGDFDDVITGNDADNWIDGGAGNDILAGGEGADTYGLSSGWGQDTIEDYSVTEDRLDFSGTDLTLEDLLIIAVDGDTIISNGENSLRLTGIDGEEDVLDEELLFF